MVFDTTHSSTEHRPDKERRSEHPTGSPAEKRQPSGEDLESCKYQQKLPAELRVQPLIDHGVSGAHHLGQAYGDETNDESGSGWVKIARPAGPLLDSRARIREPLQEGKRCTATDNTEDNIREKFAVTRYTKRRDPKERLRSHERAHRDDG